MEVGRVEKAIREGKIFECRGGTTSGNPYARKILIARGWVEKPVFTLAMAKLLSTNQNPNQIQVPNSNQNANLRLKNSVASSTSNQPENESQETKALRLLYETPANLIWADWHGAINWRQAYEFQIINFHPQDDWLIKKNFMDTVFDLYWIGNDYHLKVNNKDLFDETGASPFCAARTGFPRAYRVYLDDEQEGFFQDYKMTQCLSILKWFVHVVERETRDGVVDVDASGRIPFLLDFAVLQIHNYVRVRRHEDLDDPPEEFLSNPLPMDWDKFISQVYEMTRRKGKLKVTPEAIVPILYKKSTEALVKIQPYWPQSRLDGMRNVWIIKPGLGQRGEGIVIMDKYEEILRKFTDPNELRSLWIAQKYIERPLLVYQTKVDMRQWFLVASWDPLTVFVYKLSYIRFSSTLFQLDDLGAQTHLTNNIFQQQFAIHPNRSPNVPPNNIWTNVDFQNYLKSIGKPEIWSSIIFPQIKEIILSVVLAARHFIVHRPNTFTLQGIDFMFSEDFRPWLLEINSAPMLTPFSSVSAKLVPMVIADAIKVVFDWNGGRNPSADVGEFELIYMEKKPRFPAIVDLQTHAASLPKGKNGEDALTVMGKKVPSIDLPLRPAVPIYNNNNNFSPTVKRYLLPTLQPPPPPQPLAPPPPQNIPNPYLNQNPNPNPNFDPYRKMGGNKFA